MRAGRAVLRDRDDLDRAGVETAADADHGIASRGGEERGTIADGSRARGKSPRSICSFPRRSRESSSMPTDSPSARRMPLRGLRIHRPRESPSNSRLPHVGTTIFTVMSALAARHDAVNLGQGFPDFACDPRIVDAVDQRDARRPQSISADGRLPRRCARRSRDKIERALRPRYDADTEITVTAGATQAILTAIARARASGRRSDRDRAGLRQLRAGDPAGRRHAGVRSRWSATERRLSRALGSRSRAAITPKTRMIVVNSPHNPTGTAC